jgi:glycine/D-amino acid oxidase-like deaminating enzyme
MVHSMGEREYAPVDFPRSLWAAAATPAPHTPPLDGDRRCDIAVIGAGFTGLNTALHLTEKGVDVTVLEARAPGWGASGRTGGQTIPGLRPDLDRAERMVGSAFGPRMVETAMGAVDELFATIERHGIDCDARRQGWMQVAHHSAHVPTLRRRFEQWTRRGVAVEWLDGDEVARRTGMQTYVAGWLHPRGGCIQPLSYARGLARAALAAGVRVHGASPATAIARRDGGWRVTTPTGAVDAERVALCTNAYTDRLWPGLAPTVVPVVSIQAATRPLSDNLRESILPQGHSVADTRRLILYFRLDRDGRLVMGGVGKQAETEDPADYGGVVAAARRIFPQLGDTEWEYYWSGHVAVTRDELPHLNELAPGVVACIGFNGRGVALTTVFGRVLAEYLTGRSANALPFPVTPPRRFPFHTLRVPGVVATVAWRRLLDSWESR